MILSIIPYFTTACFMNNPFQELADRLLVIESLLINITQLAVTESPKVESDPLNVAQAAQFLGLTNQTVYDKVHKGTLPHVKQGNRIYFFKDELIQWLKSGRQKTTDDLVAQTKAIVTSSGTTRRRKAVKPN
ncbi:MAG: helix-turn-helix domain-containing protein [Stigonema ocellatum SAG 48.90 = DSM 106950]|nr:helix-turn-helix domain-containing protein [Stigonema ocellatum SAG 48.90 = DSM 106950]